MNYTYRQKFKDLLKADVLVYISGGYFGERTNTLKESIIRFIRYIPIGLWFAIRKKDIMIIGVGGAPISNKILRKSITYIMNKSRLIIVRDEVTQKYFKEAGVKKNILTTIDTALSITEDMIPKLDEKIETKINDMKCKKNIFLHLSGNNKIDNLMLEKIIPSLNNFLREHKEYSVIIGQDNIGKNNADNNLIDKIITEKKYYYEYDNPWQLYALLKKIDFIITTKLHVGIIGCNLEKSVLSFPLHPEKTKRFYKQINGIERCIPLKEVDKIKVLELLNKYHDEPIVLDDKIRRLACKNLDLMEKEVKEMSKN